MQEHTESLKSRLDRQQLCLCLAVTHARTADLPHMVQSVGFDAFYVDMEHYPISIETAALLCTSAINVGVSAFVRVPSHDQKTIGRVLDGGASGVIVPHVESAQDARGIVSAARFPPLGDRGVPGPNATGGFASKSVPETIRRMDATISVIVMLESPEAIEAAPDIAAVEGIDVLLVGSNDLALKLAIPGQLSHERMLEAFARVGEACEAHGKVLGIAGVRNDIALARKLSALGARFFIAGSDTGYFLSAASANAAEFRAMDAAARPADAK